MAEKKTGKVIHRHVFSDMLELFRLVPEDGTVFPPYKAGQYIALSRDSCKLTKKIPGSTGAPRYLYETDDAGSIKRGHVTHSYSISSAPYETQRDGYLEFYVVLEMVETGIPGRLSESLFKIDSESDNRITYMNKIVGDFTLEKRAGGLEQIVMVGTGSGLAPFASMVKQLHFEATQGKTHKAKYTLFHANRTYEELGYHRELLSVEKAGKIDFVYVPSVSRPTQRDHDDLSLGKGRANNLLRSLFEMPMREEEELQCVIARGEDASKAKQTLEQTVKPVLPSHRSRKDLLDRLVPGKAVLLTCGNPNMMDDIRFVADTNKIRFEKEDW